MRAVDLVLHWLGQSTAMGGATPDALMGQLRALLGLSECVSVWVCGCRCVCVCVCVWVCLCVCVCVCVCE